MGEPHQVAPGDVLVIWNRYWNWHQQALAFEAAGGTVLVAENGYIGRDAQGIQYYALAIGGHNGSGRWFVGDGSRLESLQLPLEPWQHNPDGHILVCAQRGIGSPTMASPDGWHHDVARRLKPLIRREIRIRYHPEDRNAPRGLPARSLDEDLAGASACVIWSSSSGVKALVHGVPVCHEAPHWVCARGAQPGIAGIENPLRSDDLRAAALRDMAWAQWSVAELASGMAFKTLLGPHPAIAAA